MIAYTCAPCARKAFGRAQRRPPDGIHLLPRAIRGKVKELFRAGIAHEQTAVAQSEDKQRGSVQIADASAEVQPEKDDGGHAVKRICKVKPRGETGEQRAERKEQPRPEYAAPSAEKEEEEEVFEREEAETDNGLMPFAKAAESAEDDAPFDHAESDVTESAAPDEAFTEAEEELGDEEYKDEYEDEEDEAEALEEEYEDEYDDDFEEGEEEGGDLPF